MKLLEKVDPRDLCVMCQIIKTSSARHCYECGHCVENFDHHCPWLSTCIGLTNHNIYFFYLWFMFVMGLTMIVQAIFQIYLFLTDESGYLWVNKNNHWLKMLFENNTISKSFWWFSIILVLILSLIVTVLIMKILKVQTVNFCTGLTTNERMAVNAQVEHQSNFDQFGSG